MLLIAEILRHGKTCLRHPHTGSGGFVHLPEHEGCLIQDSRFAHLCPEVVSLTGTLPHSGEDRISAVLCGDVVDQLLDEDCLAHAGAAEKADLAALCGGGQKVDDLDACLQHLHSRALVLKAGRFPVDHPVLCILRYLLLIIYRLSKNIEESSKGLLAYRDLNAFSGGCYLHSFVEAVAGSKHDAAGNIVP